MRKSTLKIKILAEDLHLNLYNTSSSFKEVSQVKNKLLPAAYKKKVIMRKSGFPSKKKQNLKYHSFFSNYQNILLSTYSKIFKVFNNNKNPIEYK